MNDLRFLLLIVLAFACTHCSSMCVRTFEGDICCSHSMTDEDITTNILTRISGDTGLLDQHILVNTFERGVVLSGTVENLTQRCIAIKLASQVPCIRFIHSKIKIRRFF